MMKTLNNQFRSIVLMVAAFSLAVQAQAIKPNVPVQKVATIDSLAMFLIENMWGDITIDNYEQLYETQASGMLTHWDANNKSKAAALGRDKALSRVSAKVLKYADEMGGGSTWDMVTSADVTAALSYFNTAKLYCEKYKDDSFYQNEMKDWLVLEDALGGFYAHEAYLVNWGGSMARISSAGSACDLAAMREKDYAQLHKGGKFDTRFSSISKAKAELVSKLANAEKFFAPADDDGYLSNPDQYRQQVKELDELRTAVVKQLDIWLASRVKLCESQAIPESHTASLLNDLANQIDMMLEF